MNAYGDEDGMTGGGSIASTNTQPAETGLLGGIQTEWGELVHTYVAPPMQGPDAGGPHPSFGELALLYGELLLTWLCLLAACKRRCCTSECARERQRGREREGASKWRFVPRGLSQSSLT